MTRAEFPLRVIVDDDWTDARCCCGSEVVLVGAKGTCIPADEVTAALERLIKHARECPGNLAEVNRQLVEHLEAERLRPIRPRRYNQDRISA